MRNEIKPLSKDQITATMAVKCYREQLLSEESLIKAIHAIPPEEFHVIAIKHDKVGNEHWHILVRTAYREKRMRVSTMLSRLTIQFRNGIDDKLWENHGVETVGYFSNYAAYLLHDTVTAKRASKAPYDVANFISNLSVEEIQRVLDGYSITKKPLKSKEYDIVIDRARKAGYDLQDVDEFIRSLQISGLIPAKEDGIRKAHLNGVKERMRKQERMYRLFINISVNPFDEKLFYAAEKALADKRTSTSKGKMPLMLDLSTEAIIESAIEYESGLFSDCICEVGRPAVASKTIWTGSILVHINNSCYNESYFFNCTVENNKLMCSSPPSATLYPSEELIRLKGEYKKFREGFEAALAEYDAMQKEYHAIFDDIND